MKGLAGLSGGMLALVFLAVTGCNVARLSPSTQESSALPAPVAVGPARSIVLAEGEVPSLPAGPKAWIADEVTMVERVVPHRHEAAFVYAPVSPSRLILPTGARTLLPGQAAFVPAGVWHTHERTCVVPTDCHDSFWEIRLARPGVPPASGDMQTARAFEGPPLPAAGEGAVQLRFEAVDRGVVETPTHEGESLYVWVPRRGPGLALRLVGR